MYVCINVEPLKVDPSLMRRKLGVPFRIWAL